MASQMDGLRLYHRMASNPRGRTITRCLFDTVWPILLLGVPLLQHPRQTSRQYQCDTEGSCSNETRPKLRCLFYPPHRILGPDLVNVREHVRERSQEASYLMIMWHEIWKPRVKQSWHAGRGVRYVHGKVFEVDWDVPYRQYQSAHKGSALQRRNCLPSFTAQERRIG